MVSNPKEMIIWGAKLYGIAVSLSWARLESGHQGWLRCASAMESQEDADPLKLKGHT